MPPIRPKLSITLPRNFTFHYTDAQGPKTPEEGPEAQIQQPSPPRQYRLRTRRRRGLPLDSTRENNNAPPLPRDVPIPTREAPEPAPHTAARDHQATEPVQGLLAPLPSRRRIFSPPKTPAAQVLTTFEDGKPDNADWTPRGDVNPGDSISRPTSACSIFSDSSESSTSSLASFPSNGGSCTSPESEAPDPFGLGLSLEKGKEKALSFADGPSQPSSLKPVRHVRTTTWTNDMDLHLWTTYLLYLQDPTVTPFRTGHGSAPPLGVCCRVARAAKKSWRGSKPHLSMIAEHGRHSSGGQGEQKLRDVYDEANAVDGKNSPDDSTSCKSGSATPTGPEKEKSQSRWPTSQSATRRRLRYLCKRKASPSPYQQRYLQSRSPTPYQRSQPYFATPNPGARERPTFSTRDMTFSLAASTAPSMRPDAPLANFTRDGQADLQARNRRLDAPANVLDDSTIKSSEVGLGIGGLDGPNTFPRLGSPFAGRSRPSLFQSPNLRPPSPSRSQSASITVLGPTLRSPVQLSTPLPFPSALKRRAQHQLEDELSPGGTGIHRNLFEELFGAPADSSHRRVRSRGFSLGDVSEGSRLSSVVTPPTLYDQMNSSEFANASFGDFDQDDTSSASTAERSQRLGSPFGGVGPSQAPQHASHRDMGTCPDRRVNNQQSNALYLEHTISIEERLEELDRDEASRKRMRG